jgi:putative salt-induced outer membrane protein
MNFRQIIQALALLGAALPAAAQWSGKGEAGLAIATGNSDSKQINAKVAVGRKLESWEHSFGFGALYVRSDDETTARRWETFGQTRYVFRDEKAFSYIGARYEEDRFSGFDYQAVVTTGLGNKFIDSGETRLSGQVGLGYKTSDVLPSPEAPQRTDHAFVGTAGLEFMHKLTATTTVTNKFNAEATSDNNFLQNELGVAVKMTDRIALSLGYAVRHNTNPPSGFRKTDTLSTVNLVYEVKP